MGRTGQVLLQNIGIARVDQRVLVRAAEQIARMPHIVLVQRVVQRDQHRQGVPRAPSCPACLLPHAGDRPRKAHQHRGVQVANIDAQLQRRGGGHPQQSSAGPHSPLDLPPLLGPVPGAVGAHPVSLVRDFAFQDAPCVEQNQLRHPAGPGKGDGADPGLHQVGKEPRGFDIGAAARRPRPIYKGWIPEYEIPPPRRGGVILDDRGCHARQAVQVLAGVGDSGRAGDDLGRRPIVGAHPPQPPQNAAHVRAEHSPVDVGFIQHHKS